jgi:hypothetical protein
MGLTEVSTGGSVNLSCLESWRGLLVVDFALRHGLARFERAFPQREVGLSLIKLGVLGLRGLGHAVGFVLRVGG